VQIFCASNVRLFGTCHRNLIALFNRQQFGLQYYLTTAIVNYQASDYYSFRRSAMGRLTTHVLDTTRGCPA
mgnify:CR=1